MNMIATVIQSNQGYLLVRDLSSGGEVRVNTRMANRFSPGNRIRITFNGAMTHSIPPQISAISIQKQPVSGPSPPPPPPPPPRPPAPPRPTQISATVIRTGRGSLLVRDISNNRQVVVRYPHAHHFCAGQQLTVRYDSVIMNNPLEVNATDIIPVCL